MWRPSANVPNVVAVRRESMIYCSSPARKRLMRPVHRRKSDDDELRDDERAAGAPSNEIWSADILRSNNVVSPVDSIIQYHTNDKYCQRLTIVFVND